MLWTETLEVIPDGVQTMSKMPSRYVDGVYPKYIERGQGAYVYSEEEKYIDYTMGLGAIILGHGTMPIARVIADRYEDGVLFGLPNQIETTLALKLRDLIPSAEMTRFVKTGSEACTAAIKIARAYTGKDMILTSGYHGWHPWYNASTPLNRGTTKADGENIIQFKYNDYEGLKRLIEIKGEETAAIIIEPYIFDAPKDDFLKRVRKLCDINEIVLIFDEVITGFRTPGWTAQKMFDVIPDLTCIGKAMGNGVPVGAVCGKRKYMEVLTNGCFVSSTFGGELLGIAAALEVIKILEKGAIIEQIWAYGEALKSGFNQICDAMSFCQTVSCEGYPTRTYFRFPSEAHRSLFWQETLKMGVFFGYAQFISASHGQGEKDATLHAMRQGLKMLRKYWDNPLDALRGEAASPTLRNEVTETKSEPDRTDRDLEKSGSRVA